MAKPKNKGQSNKSQGFLYAYTDESGNTGNHVFDEAQPEFWTGTLLSRTDFDSTAPAALDSCLSILGVDELHANALGLRKIEAVAYDLWNILDKAAYSFVFTVIEKRHIASIKYVDTLLDSGINKAVSPFHYGNRFFRQTLAAIIVDCLTEYDQKEFWIAYEKGDTGKFLGICTRLQWTIDKRLRDPRAKVLLMDALTWAIANPEPLLDATRSDLDAPNIVAFTLLVGRLHSILDGTGFTITRFIHDEQNQFARSMQAMYAGHQRIAFSAAPFSWITDTKRLMTYRCPFEMAVSKTSVGLQLVDIVLWVVKKHLERPLDGFPKTAKFFESICNRSVFVDFSREQLYRDAKEQWDTLCRLPMPTGEQENNGRKMLRKLEESRLRRMKEDDSSSK